MPAAPPAPSSPPTSESNNEDAPSQTEEEEETRITQLKAALWLPLGRLVDSTTLSLDKNATPQFIGALTELVWCQIGSAAGDVESFARHAGRDVVGVEDVLLLARKNEMLKGLLEEALEEERRKAQVSGIGKGAAARRTTTGKRKALAR